MSDVTTESELRRRFILPRGTSDEGICGAPAFVARRATTHGDIEKALDHTVSLPRKEKK
jgi:hypothetical protein